MTGDERGVLSLKAREFVGLGASVGAGCHPCVTHHAKAGTDAGIDAAALLAAISAAERVTADAAARMAVHARRQVPTTTDGISEVSTFLNATLAALGAAVAANSVPNIERYLTEALEHGMSHDELVDAVSVAHEVQANAARIHAIRAQKLLEAYPQTNETATDRSSTDACDDSCACHDERDWHSTGVTAAAPPAAAGDPSVAGHPRSSASAAQGKPVTQDQSSAIPGHEGSMASMMAGCMPHPSTGTAACCGTESA